MKHYTKISYWENKRRIKILHEFCDMIIAYFNNSQYDWHANERIDNAIAKEIRIKINLTIDEAHKVIALAGIKTFVIWTPPPAIGGHITNIDLISNIYHLDYYELSHQRVIDCIEIAIGVYRNNTCRSFYRTINPFFWLGLLLEWLVEIPFSLLGKAGFDSKKIGGSLIGKITKSIFYFIGVLASFLSVLQLTGYLDKFNSALKSLIESVR